MTDKSLTTGQIVGLSFLALLLVGAILLSIFRAKLFAAKWDAYARDRPSSAK